MERDQPRSLDERSGAHRLVRRHRRRQPRASSTARSCSRSRRRRFSAGLIWAGTNDGKVWNTRDGGGNVERRHEEHRRAAAVGHDSQDRAVALRSGTAYVVGRLPPDGQPRAVHLQDDRLRADVDEDQRRSAGEASARLRACRSPRTRIEGACCSRARATAFYYSLDDGAQLDASSRKACRTAPVTWIVVPKRWHDVVVSTYGRGLFILQRHHARSSSRTKCRPTQPCMSTIRDRHSGCARRPGRDSCTVEGCARRIRPASRSLDANGAVIRTLESRRARAGLNRTDLGSPATTGHAGRVSHDAAGQPAHLGGAAVQGAGDAAGRPLGHRGRAGRRVRSHARQVRRARPTSTVKTFTARARRGQGSVDRRADADLHGVDRGADPHPRRHERRPPTMVNNARDAAQTDRGRPEGERRKRRRGTALARARSEAPGGRSCGLVSRTELPQRRQVVRRVATRSIRT